MGFINVPMGYVRLTTREAWEGGRLVFYNRRREYDHRGVCISDTETRDVVGYFPPEKPRPWWQFW